MTTHQTVHDHVSNLGCGDLLCSSDPIVAARQFQTVTDRMSQRIDLAHYVRRASPLLLDALAQRGIGLDSVLSRLAPPQSGIPAICAKGSRLRPSFQRYLQVLQPPDCQLSAPLTLHPNEGLRLLWNGPQLDLHGSISGLRLLTAGAFACLEIEGVLPDTIADALLDQPVGTLIDHPLLNHRNYRVIEPARGVSGGTIIIVRTGMRGCRVPWTRCEALDEGTAELRSLLGIAAL